MTGAAEQCRLGNVLIQGSPADVSRSRPNADRIVEGCELARTSHIYLFYARPYLVFLFRAGRSLPSIRRKAAACPNDTIGPRGGQSHKNQIVTK